MRLAPAGVLVAALAAMPVLFCVPVSLIMAELSAMLPRSGGQAVFVEAALGATVGLQNACWILLSVLCDASIYPQLAAAYARSWCGGAAWVPGAVKTVMVVLTTLAHLRGTAATENLSGVVVALVMGPCAAFVGAGLPRLARSDVLARGFAGARATDASMLLSWVLWNFSGWSSFGSVAGEVRRPVARTLLRGILGLIPVVFALQALPVLVSLAVEPDTAKCVRSRRALWEFQGPRLRRYEAGYFAHVARVLGGAALAAPFAVGAQFSNVGYHSSQMIAAQRTLHFIVEDHFGVRAPPGGAPWRRFLFDAPPDGVRRARGAPASSFLFRQKTKKHLGTCSRAARRPSRSSTCPTRSCSRSRSRSTASASSSSSRPSSSSGARGPTARGRSPCPAAASAPRTARARPRSSSARASSLPSSGFGFAGVFFSSSLPRDARSQDWLGPDLAYDGGATPFKGFRLALGAGLVAAVYAATRAAGWAVRAHAAS